MADQVDTEGWSNLHHAVAGRFTSLVHSLLEQGEGTVNMSDKQERTPLHLACSIVDGKFVPLSLNSDSKDVPTRLFTEMKQIIYLLLSHGADPRILNKAGKSPLHCLVDHWLSKPYPVKEIMHIIMQLLQCGANVDEEDLEGRTVLHYVAGYPDMNVPTVESLARLVHFPNHPLAIEPAAHRNPQLMAAALSKKEEESNLPKYTGEDLLSMKELLINLLRCGSNVNAADNKGNTPLHFAIATNKFDLVKELLKVNVNINVRNNLGQTPFHHAVSDREKFKNFGILLLHKGGDATIADNAGCTPIGIIRGADDSLCFLKHLFLLMKVNMHPIVDLHENLLDIPVLVTRTNRVLNDCQQECEDLSSYFELDGRSQLPLLLQSYSLPSYTERDFIVSKIKRQDFTKRFPIYSPFLLYKFTQDKNRRKMIEGCRAVFSCFGGKFHYNEKGRLMYVKNSHWECLPEELKSLILSYLSNDDLEFLEKNLI